MVYGAIDKSGLTEKSGIHAEIAVIANHVLAKFKDMEDQNPQLLADDGWAFFKEAFRNEMLIPSENLETLESLYHDLVDYLHAITLPGRELSADKTQQVFRLGRFLPDSFVNLHEEFQRVNQLSMFEDGKASLAERLLFGEYENGLADVPRSAREEVRKKVLAALVYDHSEINGIKTILARVNEAEIFELLKLNDENLEVVAEADHSPRADVAHVILKTREQLAHEHQVMFKSPGPAKTDQPATADHDDHLAELAMARARGEEVKALSKKSVAA